jgi:hypothetical protein
MLLFHVHLPVVGLFIIFADSPLHLQMEKQKFILGVRNQHLLLMVIRISGAKESSSDNAWEKQAGSGVDRTQQLAKELDSNLLILLIDECLESV